MRSRYIASSCDATPCRASHSTNLLQAFRPLPLLTNPHAQTIVAAKLTFAYEPPATTRLVKLPDGDMLAVLESLHQDAPASPVTLVGFSLGGNIVLKLAGEWTRNSWPG